MKRKTKKKKTTVELTSIEVWMIVYQKHRYTIILLEIADDDWKMRDTELKEQRRANSAVERSNGLSIRFKYIVCTNFNNEMDLQRSAGTQNIHAYRQQ